MPRTRLAAVFVSLFITSSGAAFAGTPATGGTATNEHAAQLSQSFSELHTVSQWSVTLSEMADKRAKSDLVKNYARTSRIPIRIWTQSSCPSLKSRESTSYRRTHKARRARA